MQDQEFTLTQSSPSFLKQFPKFSILTGKNGSRKTQTLDFIFNILRNTNFEYMVSKIGDLEYALYIESEATRHRKVRGTRSYDFKYEYVYEKLKGYLSFDDKDLRDDVIHTIDDNINTKIAIALADRYFFGYEQRSYIQEIIKHSLETLSFNEIEQFKQITIGVAEELIFLENLLQEPITIAENIFKQHLVLVYELFINDFFNENRERFLKFIKTKFSEYIFDGPDFRLVIEGLTDKSFSSSQIDVYNQHGSLSIDRMKLSAFAKVIENDRQQYYEICSEYCEEFYQIMLPNKIINLMIEKYFKDYSIAFVWDRSYAGEFYIQLCSAIPPIDMTLNTIYIYTKGETAQKSLWYRIKFYSDEITIQDQKLYLEPEIFKRVYKKLSNEQALVEEELKAVYGAISDHGIIPTGKYHFVFNKNGKPIELHSLSSGELLAVRLIFWAYVSRGLDFEKRKYETVEKPSESKIKLLLLDEVDKHFDSKLTRTLMSIITEEFIASPHEVKIIMTTHKPDTIALVPIDKGSKIFTIQQKKQTVETTENGKLDIQVTEVVETHKLLAMFRLTGNMKEITGHHHAVYTESRSDALFYEGVYYTLLKHSNNLRVSKITALWQLMDENFSYLLSKRSQMSFISVSADKDGEGGCSEVIKSIASDITAYKSSERDNNPENEQDKEEKHFREIGKFYDDFRLYGPYGIIDYDYNKQPILGSIYNAENRRDIQRVVVLERHSVENYIFDPFVLSSLIKNKRISGKIDSSIGSDPTYRESRLKLKEIYIKIYKKINDNNFEGR